MELKETQDAQIILRDAAGGITDKAHAPRGDIGQPVDIVVNVAVTRDRKRVNGEVAPLGVAAPVAAEGDLGVAAIGHHILAQCRHLEHTASGDDGNGAVVDAGRHRLEAGALDAADRFRRQRGGGDVDIAQGHAE